MTDNLKTYSPIDNSLYIERPYASVKEIEDTLIQANLAQKQWQQSSFPIRKQCCHAAIDYLVENREAIGEELCWQIGRPILHAQNELKGLEERARYMIEQAETALSNPSSLEKLRLLRFIKREPVGLVFVIAPWNYPFLTAVNTIIPAIMAGNSVLFKTSAQTPLVAERFAQAFKTANLPEGVFQYLHLTHEDTDRCIQSNLVDAVAFTGSVDAGIKVEQLAAGRFIPVGLELGGKDAAYIREDADIDYAVTMVTDGAFFNSGQSCCGIERIYVHHAVYEEFLAKMISLVEQYILDRPDNPHTTLGPLVRTSNADFVREQITEAIAQGARIHIDPKHFPMSKEGSPYLAPQIVTNVSHKMRLMTEETFGPVVGIMPVSDDEEAIALINDSEYGLTAAVFTKDIENGIALGEQLNVGTFFLNRCDYLDPSLAWTGVKKSGRGCTLSTLGYDALTRPKSFYIKFSN